MPFIFFSSPLFVGCFLVLRKLLLVVVVGEAVVGVGGRCRAVFVILVVGIVYLGEWHTQIARVIRNTRSLRKQPTFRDATTGFFAKWRLRNERRNSILMTRHYPDLVNASYWLNQISLATRPIRSIPQIWVVSRHQYEISALVLQRHFGEKPVVASRNVGAVFSG